MAHNGGDVENHEAPEGEKKKPESRRRRILRALAAGATKVGRSQSEIAANAMATLRATSPGSPPGPRYMEVERFRDPLREEDEDRPLSLRRGGLVRRTGIYRLHRGERVVPARKAKSRSSRRN